MTQQQTQETTDKKKIESETALIPWSELARFFAAGTVLKVSHSLALTDVALAMAQDNTTLLRRWMEQKRVTKMTDETAQQWFASKTTVLATVVKPWVLVQQSM